MIWIPEGMKDDLDSGETRKQEISRCDKGVVALINGGHGIHAQYGIFEAGTWNPVIYQRCGAQVRVCINKTWRAPH